MKKTQEPLISTNGQVITEIRDDSGKIIRRRVETINTEPSMTEQQFAQDADANYIMKKYISTGIDPFQRKEGYYADISEIPDLSQALQTVTEAQMAFDSLDSNIRSRFGNSPVELLKFLEIPENYQEGVKLGIFKSPEKAPEPISVIVTNPQTTPSN